MKKSPTYSLLLILMLMGLAFTAQAEPEKVVKSKIDKVTVFLQGAQVYRSGYFSAGTGNSFIVFENLSGNLNPKSLQAKGRGDFLILDVKHRIKHPEPTPVKESKVPASVLSRIKRLNDSLTFLSFEISDLNEEKTVLEQEKSLLLQSKTIKGERPTGDTVSLYDPVGRLSDALGFFRERFLDINKELQRIRREVHYAQAETNRIQTDLNELNAYKAKLENPQRQTLPPVHQVVVTINAKQPVNGRLTINYVVNNASWTPSYDLRAESYGKPMALTYKARVHQNTGVDWDGVKLRLATNNPYHHQRKPNLPVWYVNYLQDRPRNTVNIAQNKEMIQLYQNMSDEVMAESDVRSPQVTALDIAKAQREQRKLLEEQNKKKDAAFMVSEVVNTMTNAEFDIDMKYTIASDNEPHLVVVQHKKLPAEYVHYLVPKLDRDAFLMARLTGWEEMNLLPAKANIYYQSTFIGETAIDPVAMNDTMDIDLGRDRGLRVSREKRSDEIKDRAMGGNRVRSIAYELEIRNTKNVPATIVIEDQVPVPGSTEIKVDVGDVDGAEHQEKTGKLIWKFKLNGHATQTVGFDYAIEFDKDKPLWGVNP